MQDRHLNPLDRFLAGVGDALRTIASPAARPTRQNPADGIAEFDLSERARTHAAGLMRVNHAGEVAAQGLYQGHAAVARDATTAKQMQQAADEELDHLAWCEQRLTELDAGPSRLSPLWYTGSFVIGAASGVLGDQWSLGFIAETERQVCDHLSSHLKRLPEEDARSRAIVEQMRVEEQQHGENAIEAGAAALPAPVRVLMRLTSKVMTETAYRF
ncbi:MAG: 2-polyprenyl-3-methyl-6-methoxy-1,4-benzoquinone monooxygenase [Proteobacteria bacterium]|nr:2-polyprenyl-3-methyl-6-methoxy-1,4-benzoquinone monooxygenase [Pseudomonadota bacterium]MDA1063403.1 2-polyprenyl-3-methyl-6-methoxy-1,4-benzoquinone monooxygenase [Pseudomonadota bacterium]